MVHHRMRSELELIGLSREREALVSAVRRRESLLLIGPAGSGKTALVRSALEAELHRDPLVYVPHFDTLHALLVAIARELLRYGNGRFRSAADQTSIHLKGLLWEAFEREPMPVVLDGVNAAGHQTYRFFQRLYFTRGMTLIATARDHAHLGELGRLFWDPRQTRSMQPLADIEARRLFEAAADRFQIRGLDLEDFREKALDAAKGNPGQIVEMCRFAANPMYLTDGRHIKFAPLRIDVLMALL
jgi:AAA ATPase domain